jgi:hypothetical protein
MRSIAGFFAGAGLVRGAEEFGPGSRLLCGMTFGMGTGFPGALALSSGMEQTLLACGATVIRSGSVAGALPEVRSCCDPNISPGCWRRLL